MTEPKKAPNLREKLNAVYSTIEHIDKLGSNDKQNYDFVRAADVARAIRKAFIEQRVYAEVQNFEYLGQHEIKTRSGGVMFSALVRVQGVFHDLDSDERILFSGLGDGADSGDKGIYKSQTGALKNALKNAFLIPDTADPEADERVDDAVEGVTEFDSNPMPARRSRRVNQEPAEDRGSRPEGGFKRNPPPAAEIPTEPLEPSLPEEAFVNESETDIVASPEPQIPAPDNKFPDEPQLAEYGKRLRALGDDLGSKGGLKSGVRMPVNRKVIAYLLRVTGAADATKISTAQWTAFFDFVDKITTTDDAAVGFTKLAKIVDGGKA